MGIVVGITGGVATGKSTVTAMFGELGSEMISADEIAREVLAPGTAATDEVVRQFGDGMLTADGLVDRGKLGEAVFGDPEKRKMLDSITHPHIISTLNDRIDRFRSSAGQYDVLAAEIPLLMECQLERLVDKIVVVAAEQDAQLSRLRIRGLSAEQALDRIAAQMPVEDKIPLADFVIHTDTSMDDTRSQVETVMEKLREDVVRR